MYIPCGLLSLGIEAEATSRGGGVIVVLTLDKEYKGCNMLLFFGKNTINKINAKSKNTKNNIWIYHKIKDIKYNIDILYFNLYFNLYSYLVRRG